jgi:signal recognition particle GTPase
VPIKNQGNESSTLASDLSHDETRQQQNPGGSFSSKLPRRNNSTKVSSPGHHNSSSSSSDIVEINLKDILSQIINNLSNSSCVNEWFKLSNVYQQQQQQVEMANGSNLFCNEIDEVIQQEKTERSLFESIENALNHIDFNLKRNSDFINELTKLLDTSRAIQQEKQLKKLLKSIEDEKLNSSNLSVPANQSQSQPSSPNLRSSSQGGAAAPGTARTERKQFVAKEDQLKKPKSRSFKGN